MVSRGCGGVEQTLVRQVRRYLQCREGGARGKAHDHRNRDVELRFEDYCASRSVLEEIVGEGKGEIIIESHWSTTYVDGDLKEGVCVF